MSEFDIARGFPGGIPPIPTDHAVKRVVAFCCSPRSGWRSYDLAGAAARAAGHFDTVAPWSLLWADALAGRLSVDDLDGFSLERRTTFAERISAVPAAKDLAVFDESEREAVRNLCTFGYPGVWAPKSTKVSSLYRPHAVPVLDGYVAMAFGFNRTDFSEGKAPRWNRIARVIDALAAYLDEHRDQMIELRETARVSVRDIDVASDLRLLDIVIWCSQDDFLERPGKKRNGWLDSPNGAYEPDPVTPIPVTTGGDQKERCR
ncbi:hypothetical protein A5697_26275 [Mycobacterium sp. E3251]|uniref:DUF6308 family protein n=1 Tax=Mycobacterium sp. E3251 TaxID=1834144 RepID=UPI0007FD90CF|nr:DUF6308 family protein [Mycobacterium sp. E3251]OBG94395.1 hypothetical protein A5697_26275 [Mycobacterium sp. E3251]